MSEVDNKAIHDLINALIGKSARDKLQRDLIKVAVQYSPNNVISGVEYLAEFIHMASKYSCTLIATHHYVMSNREGMADGNSEDGQARLRKLSTDIVKSFETAIHENMANMCKMEGLEMDNPFVELSHNQKTMKDILAEIEAEKV